MLVNKSSPFGGKTRSLVLLALSLLEESFPRELSRVLEVSLNGVLQALRSLEKDGLVAGRTVGRTRVFSVNPRYFARGELVTYLKRLIEAEAPLRERISQLRRRPRRTNKPL